MANITVNAEVFPDEFDDEDLIDELTRRGYVILSEEENKVETPSMKLVEILFEKYRNDQDINTELRDLFYSSLGRIV